MELGSIERKRACKESREGVEEGALLESEEGGRKKRKSRSQDRREGGREGQTEEVVK